MYDLHPNVIVPVNNILAAALHPESRRNVNINVPRSIVWKYNKNINIGPILLTEMTYQRDEYR
jgi:hypothetical protein